MTPPPRPPRRRADPARDQEGTSREVSKKVRAAEIPLPPPARLEPDGASRPVFLCATARRLERQPVTASRAPTGSTQPCDNPLARLGSARRIRGAACVASVRPAVRRLRYVGRRANAGGKLVHECRHDRQPRHLNNAHATQLARHHVAMFLQPEVELISSLRTFARPPANHNRPTRRRTG